MSVCAEPIVLGRALLEGRRNGRNDRRVRHPKPDETDREMAVVSPCGACRELILDHCPEALVILREGERLVKVPARRLLPAPYRR